jgi:uncharacterized protein YegL
MTMAEQMDKPFKVREEELVNNPTKRCPCLLVLDTSSSMDGEPIAELNQGVAQFIRELQNHDLASASVELGILTFDSEVKERLDFTLVENVRPPQLTADGLTSMGEGVDRAIQRLRDRRQMYRDNGVSSYVPWLVLMTDGGPTDSWEQAARRLKTLAEQRKLIVFAVGIGDGCDFTTLGQFCPADRPPVRLSGLNFAAFFHFVSKSMEQVVSGAAPDEGFAIAAAAKDSDFSDDPDDPDNW